MVSTALMTAALTAAMAQAKPEAVVLTTSPAITRPALTSSRTLAIYESSIALRQHLETRIQETWGFSPESTPPIDPSRRTFYVHLDWPEQDRVVVGVADPDNTLVERTVQAADLGTAKVMVWLLVRSTVERALIRPSHEVPVAEVADVTPPITEETPIEEIASPPPVKAASATTDEVAVVGEVAPTRIEKPNRYALSLMALSYFDSGSGVAAVPAVQARFFLHKWLVVGADLTFRHEERAEGALDVYHLPITGYVGARPWDSLPMELGLAATFDPKVVSLPQDSGLDAGFYLGPYVRGRLPLFSFGRSQIALVGDATLAFALRRNAYFVNGQSLEDGVVSFRVAGGLEWAWH